MDHLNELEEEVKALKKLREHYEDQLKLVGFELCDLPEDVSAMLDECVELQTVTNLSSLQDTYLDEYYYTRKKERIDYEWMIEKMRAEIKEQEEKLKKEATECAQLEKFIEETNERIATGPKIQSDIEMLEIKIQSLQEKQKSMTIPEDLDVDELIRKVELLKTHTKPPGDKS